MALQQFNIARTWEPFEPQCGLYTFIRAERSEAKAQSQTNVRPWVQFSKSRRSKLANVSENFNVFIKAGRILLAYLIGEEKKETGTKLLENNAARSNDVERWGGGGGGREERFDSGTPKLRVKTNKKYFPLFNPRLA